MVNALSATALQVELRTQDAALVVMVTGEVDTTNADVLHDAIDTALDGSPALVVVDLTQVGFIDSAGLATLVRGLKRATAQETPLRLVVTNPHLENILTITGLQNVFAVYHDLGAAARREK